MLELKKEILEGPKEMPEANANDIPFNSVTSTEQKTELSNVPTPTPEQEISAGIEPVPEVEPQETEPELEPEPEITEEDGVVSGPALQTFTQSQVDEITGKTRKETRERTLRSVYSRYGVTSEDELDDLFGNAQRYETLKDQFDEEKLLHAERENLLNDLSEQVALLKSGIDEKRYDDAKFILRGKGLEVTLENIESELDTHPEWKKQQEQVQEANPHFTKRADLAPEAEPTRPAPSRLSVLGNSSADTPAPKESERDIALKKIFKV